MSGKAATAQFQFIERPPNQSLEFQDAPDVHFAFPSLSSGIPMRFFLFVTICLTPLSTNAFSDEAKPTIDLSTQTERVIIEEDYQSIRPGAMDERFQREGGLGNAGINLSYDPDEPDRDEYGLIREVEGPATTDYAKPPIPGSTN